MGQGYQENQIIRDLNGIAVDYHLLNSIGRPVKEILPNGEPFWLELFDRVARNSIAERCEHEYASLSRWYDVYAFSIGGDRVGVLVEDITERKQREHRQDFLLKLSDTLRPLDAPEEVANEACRLLNEELTPSRTQYTIMVDDTPGEEIAEVIGQHVRNGEQLVRLFPMNAFGKRLVEMLRSGRTLILTDVDRDERITKAEQLVLLNAESPAAITVPRVKNCRLVITLTVHDIKPRQWTANEISLVEEVAERTWAAVERAGTEQALRNSEKRLQLIVNLAPDLLWDSEPDGSTNWYNNRWLKYTGQSLEEAIGWGWVNVIHPDDREASAMRYAQAVKTGELLQQEHRIRRHDGEYRWFVVSASPVKNTNDQVIKVYGAATDIHDRKQAEEKIRAAELQYRTRKPRYVTALQNCMVTVPYCKLRWIAIWK